MYESRTCNARAAHFGKVRMGPRGVTFHEELAARTFAAQLHQRLLWLRELAECESGDRQPR